MINGKPTTTREPATPVERIVYHLLSTAAVRPGPCSRLYDERGDPLPDGAALDQAGYEGRRYWDASDSREARWAYSVTPIAEGRRVRQQAHSGSLLPDRALENAVNSLLAVEDYARWYPAFAAGTPALAIDIWGLASPRSRFTGESYHTRQSALRHCVRGLSRERQLAALALAGIMDSPESLLPSRGTDDLGSRRQELGRRTGETHVAYDGIAAVATAKG